MPKDRRETPDYVVLTAVLLAHPEHLTEADIVRELVGDRPVFGEHDEIENHIRDLVNAGIFRREGKSILPTHPVLYLREIGQISELP